MTNHSYFAVDTRIFCNPLQYKELQEELQTIKKFTQKWIRSLNESVLDTGHTNPNLNYFFSQQIKLISGTSQRDLGIMITSDLKWEQHIIKFRNAAKTVPSTSRILKGFGEFNVESPNYFKS